MITAQACAQQAMEDADKRPPILYSTEDCQEFIENTVERAGGSIKDYRGVNDIFRNACSYIAPLNEAKRAGKLVPGAVLFRAC